MATQTAAQHRAAARAAYVPAMTACPTNQILNRLGDKWVGLVLKELGDGTPRRHAQLARAMVGASQKMLTQTLRHLERDGLVSRKVTAGVPPQVHYRLTALGETLMPVLRTVTAWAEEHMDEVEASRARHDDRESDAAAV